ncbi:hypothetical protein G6F32_014557 [Rhizopus arrhizus]|nr:hypothetical protein G6F32_014557 [Rhizopus arrhizus]
MLFGHGEGMQVAVLRRFDHVGAAQLTVLADVPDQQAVAAHQADRAEVPHAAVAVGQGMGGEWQRGQVRAPAGFAQREQAAVDHRHRGVGDVGIVVVAHRQCTGDAGARRRVLEAAGLLFTAELRCGHHAPVVGQAAIAVEAPAMHHAVAVEPVVIAEAIALAGPAAARWPGRGFRC